MEKTVEIKSCKNCGVQFEITDKDLEFYDKVSPVFGGRKYGISSPTLCPDCRQQRRLAFRNERKLYRRKCDATGENIISIYSPDKPYKVYDQKVWWSDNWNPLDYGREFDFSRSFFEQFAVLFEAVPKMSLIVKDNLNADFTNYAGSNKNSYLLFNSEMNDDCMYVTTGFFNKNSNDCLSINNSELCYESLDIKNSFRCFYSHNLSNCSDCLYCNNCISCTNCCLCIGLNNKEYCFLNLQYSKEEYEEKLNDFYKNKDNLFSKFNTLKSTLVYKDTNGFKVESSSGDYLYNSKNVNTSYEIYNSENCKFCLGIHNANNCYDITFFGVENMENSYEGTAIGLNSNNIYFSGNIVNGNSNIYYSYFLYLNSQNCFGCIGLRNKQYCILNKQYTKKEYEELVPKIIEHMKSTGERGEFFPIELSPFGYNETVAQEYYPISAAEASSKNYKWQTNNYDPQIPAGVETITKDNIPQDIQSVTDDILKKLFICEVTGRPFRIIKQELEFYKKHNLPLPTKHPDQRHLERLAKRNPRKLWKRKCDCSNCASNNNSNGAVEFLTTYSPERKEKVYCETCYNKEVYG